jgi:hypothetical protein
MVAWCRRHRRAHRAGPFSIPDFGIERAAPETPPMMIQRTTPRWTAYSTISAALCTSSFPIMRAR